MAGSAAGSFISGLFDGIQVKHGWQDRKRRQLFEDEDRGFLKEDRKMEAERHGWSREDQQWEQEDRSHTRSERERTKRLRDEEERMHREATAAAMEAMNAPVVDSAAPPLQMPSGPGAAIPAAQPAADTPLTASPFITPGSAEGRPSLSYGRDLEGPVGSIPGDVRLRELPGSQPPPGRPTATRPPVTRDQMATLPSETKAQAMARQRAEAELAAMSPDDRAAAEARNAADAAAEQEQSVAMADHSAVDAAQAQAPKLSYGEIEPTPKTGAKTATGLNALVSDQTAPAQAAPATVPSAPSMPVEAGGASAAVAAREIGMDGTGGRGAPTAARKKDAVEGFIEQYTKVAVPKLIQGYMARGDVQMANGLLAFSRSEKGNRIMGSWARAAQALTIEDYEGGLDHLSEMYNQIDDGYEIVRGESGLQRDEKGNITGLTLTMIGPSGNKFQQHFAGTEDILARGIMAGAPENLTTYLKSIVESGYEVQKDTIKHGRNLELAAARRGGGQVNTREDAVDFLIENQTGFLNLDPAAQETMVDQLMSLYGGGGSAAASAPPVYR